MTTIVSQNIVDYSFIQTLKNTSQTVKDLKDTVKQIWTLRMQIHKLSSLERKADTRSKIIIGGLIKKAGLDYLYEQKAEALYGMLLACKQQLVKNPAILDEWTKLGAGLKI